MTAIKILSRALALSTTASFLAATALLTIGAGQPAYAASSSVPASADAIVSYAQQQAQANGLDPDVFVRQIAEESGFNPNAYNAASGASGIAQIVPAGHPSVNPWDPYAAIAYMAQLDATYFRQFGRYDLMLAAYNAGPAVIKSCRCVPPYPQTQTYVRDILSSNSTPPAPASAPSTSLSTPTASPSIQAGTATGRRQFVRSQRRLSDRRLRSGPPA